MSSISRIWADRKIGIKLTVLTLVAAIGLAATVFGGLRALSNVHNQVDWSTQTADARSEWQEAATGEQKMMANLRLAALIVMVAKQPDKVTDAEGPFNDARALFDKSIADVVALTKKDPRVPADAIKQIESVDANAQTFLAAADQQMKALKDNDFAGVAAADTEVTKAAGALDESMAPITASMTGQIAGATQSIKDAESSARVQLIVYALIALAILVAVALAVRAAVVKPLRKVKGAIDGMARGDMTVELHIDSKDEVGEMATALAEAQGAVRDAIAAVALSAGQVNDSSQNLSEATAQISVAAEQVTAQAGAVAAASGQISGSLQTVAAGSEEMGASIGEIARNATSAANVAAEAVSVAAETNRAMTELSDSSVEIGKVVNVITSIAEQTNMLALNATIEAARAGEAGKGFAVVAGEVKDLAQETAEATAEITSKVGQIQGKAEEAVAAIAKIGEIIDRINDYQGTIASAVEEQTATTAEINKNMSQAATGSAEIATNVDGVASAARLTSQNVLAAQSSADELAQLSSELRSLVGRFTV